MPFYHARNEQAMVHAAAGYARMKNRLQTLACTSSIGPGATNMVTGAALATINRLPVLLLPGDVFATRAPGTVLQELEDPTTYDVTRQRHAPAGLALLGPDRAPRAARAGAAGRDARADRPGGDRRGDARLPQDVQAEAFDWPEELFDAARLARPPPAAGAGGAGRGRGADPRRAQRPLIVCRRRHDLRRGDRRAARARRGDRDPRRRDAGRQGLAALRPSAGARRDRRHRHDRGQRARRARPTSCSASARAGATSRPRRARSSPTTTCASSTSTSRRSTPSSTPACRSSPTRGSASRRSPRRSRASTLRDAGERLGRGGRARVHARHTAAAGAEPR